MADSKKHVAILYHMFPHYRRAVIEELSRSQSYEFSFFGSSQSYDGIESLSGRTIPHFTEARFRQVGKFIWQPGAFKIALSNKYCAIIFLGNPNHLATWLSAAVARMRGIRVFFWTHGWLRPEPAPKRMLRVAFYRLAHHVLVYGERARQIGICEGYPAERITVIFNSLDARGASKRRLLLSHEKDPDGHPLFANRRPTIVCVARLTKLCRFDILIKAAEILREQQQRTVNILLVGDGPEKHALQNEAASRGVEVTFYGACYDEDELARIVYHADLTVSPGKIGLTAIQSLMYGTPVITHGDLNAQMPEVEALVEGLTGSFFKNQDPVSLATKIAEWLDTQKDRVTVRSNCIRVIEDRWNPSTQLNLIESALSNLLTGRVQK